MKDDIKTIIFAHFPTRDEEDPWYLKPAPAQIQLFRQKTGLQGDVHGKDG